ncbi:probable 39S ribosomal protein L49, mitochondrial [Sitophilus oryzae]|uniref:Large ribosomal subunit protein mL49 n=1 Tax=Sitophilus oryzae TaxID=7048 RepID=A0A6J2YKY5_SITOR|nr:probable 39S ribosomal protein L49, mitochondrial [Sitophilus oryzae]
MFIASRCRAISHRAPSLIFPKFGQKRDSSFQSSPYVEDLGSVNRSYEVTKDTTDWSYVQRVLPPKVVPTPVKKDVYPSGWRPQTIDIADKPYFIKRTKNHMIPCYLDIGQRGIKRTTLLKSIQGDIWQLEKEIKEFLQPQVFQILRVQVNEFVGYIRINGDHVNAIKYFLEQKGY